MSDSVANACKARAVGGCTAEKAALAPLRSADRACSRPSSYASPRADGSPAATHRASTTTIAAAPHDDAARRRCAGAEPIIIVWAARQR